MSQYADLQRGDPAPYFHQRSLANPSYAFDTAAGRYIVLCFFGSAGDPHAQAAVSAMRGRPDFFDDLNASFFGVSIDPEDESGARIAESYPGYRFLLDFDLKVSRLYGAAARDAEAGTPVAVRRFWAVLDPTLRVLAVVPFAADRSDIAAVFACLDALPPPARFAGIELQAPIIVLPNVFEPEFCERLIGLYDEAGGEESGFMRDVGGKTVLMSDRRHKVRKDHILADKEAIAGAQARFLRRVVPEIAKVHQFHVTRMERYLVACYAAEDGAHFNAHRDNTTMGTAHRRFAVSVNLNDDFEGGEVSFPEYGRRGFKAPAGGAVVFSCSLLHAVSKVTSGRRYAFLPFLYDDAAARIREENARFLEAERAGYKAAPGA